MLIWWCWVQKYVYTQMNVFKHFVSSCELFLRLSYADTITASCYEQWLKPKIISQNDFCSHRLVWGSLKSIEACIVFFSDYWKESAPLSVSISADGSAGFSCSDSLSLSLSLSLCSRVCVIRGQVLASDGTPLVGVNVTFQHNPEYGYTLSRQDGR